jgi:hypothetical protein
MKKLILIFPLLLFSLGTELTAQKVNEGVYLTAKDFTNSKVSFVNDQINNKYKIHLNEIFNSPKIKIIKGDSVIKLNKESVFGYCDKKNNSYRYYNKAEYKIINPSEKILLYSKTSMEGGFRSSHVVTNYYFSQDATSPIYALTKSNLKEVFLKDVAFIELLNVYFDSDKDLAAYDNINKGYMLNRVYELSQQKTTMVSNN